MATPLTLIRSLITDAADININPGQYIYCADDNRTFYDVKDNTRIEVDFVLDSESLSLDQIVNPKVDTVYYLEQIDKFYTYTTDGFKNVVYDIDVLYLYGTYALIPFTMENPLTGMKLAPRTLASAVYTSTGESVESLVNNFSRIGRMSSTIVVSADGVNVFRIPFPFDGYFASGNIMDVYFNGLLLNKGSDYILTDNEIVFLESHHISKNDIITFMFLYNSSVVGGDNINVAFDGAYIINNTIPTNRLKNITDDITTNSSDVLPTSKALNTAFNTLNNKIDYISTVYRGSYNAVPTGTSSEMLVTIENFELKDGTEINVRPVVDMQDNAKINVNNTGSKIIRYNGTTLTGYITKGKVITLVYSSESDAYNVKLYSDYRIKKLNYFTQTRKGDNIIRFKFSEYVPGITPITVYQNNLRLFEGLNYELKDDHIQLINYTAEYNDIFCFELDIVEKYFN